MAVLPERQRNPGQKRNSGRSAHPALKEAAAVMMIEKGAEFAG